MPIQLLIGLFTEGSTDNRFLESIVKRTFFEIAFECNREIEIVLRIIKIEKRSLTFVQQVIEAARKGVEQYGIMVLCVHTDADYKTDSIAFSKRINPALELLKNQDPKCHCKVITSIVPIRMIEAWMLADIELLKNEIGTKLSDNELGVNRLPENIANPKVVIEEAIRIARRNLTRRKRAELKISDLYLPLGQNIDINKLNSLTSFIKFKESIRSAYRSLNLL